MQSKAATVEQYLSGLPADRRGALEAVRRVVLANLDKDYEEGMQYGMIGYYVPHRVFPPGYHCDPKQPLQGFTMLAPDSDEEIDDFCRTFEVADPETQRMIRLSFELAIAQERRK